MDKILDSEFRNTLYKNLVDAGYDKKEAQKIVGVKYHDALKKETLLSLQILIDSVGDEKYDVTVDADKLNEKITELKRIKGVIA